MNWPKRSTFRRSQNYLAACATEIASPLLSLYATRAIRNSGRTDDATVCAPKSWRRLLLMGSDHIGDILYRTSSLPALKQGLPDCQIDIVAPDPACSVLEGNPYIRKIHRFEASLSCHGADFETLQREQYDALLCYNSGSLQSYLKAALKLGIPNRAAYVDKGFSAWITLPLSIRRPQPYPAYFRDAVSQLTDLEPNWGLQPLVYLSQQDEFQAETLWKKLNLDESKPALACFVTSRQPVVWSEEKFAETLRHIHGKLPLNVILCGASSDEAKLQQIAKNIGFPCSMNAGRLGLRATIALLKKCTAVLSTDSGPRHLANAANTPVIFVRNLWSNKVETGIYYPDNEYDMAPDAELLSPEEHSRQLKNIVPENVARKVLEVVQTRR